MTAEDRMTRALIGIMIAIGGLFFLAVLVAVFG